MSRLSVLGDGVYEGVNVTGGVDGVPWGVGKRERGTGEGVQVGLKVRGVRRGVLPREGRCPEVGVDVRGLGGKGRVRRRTDTDVEERYKIWLA